MRVARGVGVAGRAALVVIAFAIAGAVVPASPAGARQIATKKPRDLGPPSSGPALAPVVVERFCDYAQAQCASVDDALAELVRRHPQQVRVIFRSFPMRHIATSEALAQASWEAHAQGKYFAFVAVVYAAKGVDRRSAEKLAARAGLDLEALASALADGRHAARVDEDQAWAGRFGVDGVPALVWNGKRLPAAGARFEDYERLFAQALAEARARLDGGVSLARLYPTLLRDSVKARAAEVVRGSGFPGDASALPRRVNVPVVDAPARGEPGAEVRIVVFGDYECQPCRSLLRTLARLEEAYPGRIALVWKHAPLDAHPKAVLAASAAVCAQRQGKFWEFHVRLYAQPHRLDREQLLDHAAQLGLDVERFVDELDAGVCDRRVNEDLADARALGVHGQTPILFVNGIQLIGEKPYAALRAVIDDELLPGALAQISE